VVAALEHAVDHAASRQSRHAVRAAVLDAADAALPIAKQHVRLVVERERQRLAGRQVRAKGHRIPTVPPVEFDGRGGVRSLD
jgi:hypothetical protein